VQDLLMPNGGRRRMAQLIKDIEFNFAEAGDPSLAGMHTGAVMERGMLSRWWAQGMGWFGAYLTRHPMVQEWLILGLSDSKTRDASVALLRDVIRYSVNEGMNRAYQEAEASSENKRGPDATEAPQEIAQLSH
jgi:hypothetical protein